MIYALTFLQSNLLELPIYCGLVRRLNWRERILFFTVLNSVTHPIVFFCFMRLPLARVNNILLAESFAIVAEFLIVSFFLRVSARRAFTASMLANLLSWQMGPLLTYWLWLH